MNLMEAIYSRRAVREFTPEPVDEKTLQELIDAAIQAPSAVNEQPWLFSVVLDKTLLARISAEAAHILKTTAVGLLSHSRHFQEILNDPNFDIFYYAPALVVISAVAKSPWAVENCALAAENLMLAARGLGLAEPPINGSRLLLRFNHSEQILCRARFGIFRAFNEYFHAQLWNCFEISSAAACPARRPSTVAVKSPFPDR